MKKRMIINLNSLYCYTVAFLFFFAVPQDIKSWDLAVANDGGINFFDFNGNIESSSQEFQQLSDLYVLAYDSFQRRIFFTVNEHNTSIFMYELSERILTPLVPRQTHEVQGIAHDVTSRTLFWTDGNGHTIWKLPLTNTSNVAEPLLRFKNEVPTGIAISSCKRLLFWTNSNHTSASIERSYLNGSNYIKLIKDDVFLPLAITVDEVYEKLYWTDDRKGIYYRIERSNLDGSDRELVIEGTNQEPLGITVFNRAVYWTDTIQRKVWTLSSDMSFPNHTMAKLNPELFYNFNLLTPYGIAAFKDRNFECDIMPAVLPPKKMFPIEKKENSRNSSLCSNDKEHLDGSCKDQQDLIGPRYPTSSCHNYCLNKGECSVNGVGVAECRCLPGFKGMRCEINACQNFCLNGGQCFLNESTPLCSCDLGFLGKRCETSLDFICDQICSGTVRKKSFMNLCNCNATKFHIEESVEFMQSLNTSQCQKQRVILITLICCVAAALLVIVVLSIKVCALRRRPRIKKRIIVSKGIKSQTPMTARPHSSPEQCEITIENCCNMNICETPCFEPNLRTSRSSFTSPSIKTEDKKVLLKNMEGEFESLDNSYS